MYSTLTFKQCSHVSTRVPTRTHTHTHTLVPKHALKRTHVLTRTRGGRRCRPSKAPVNGGKLVPSQRAVLRWFAHKRSEEMLVPCTRQAWRGSPSWRVCFRAEATAQGGGRRLELREPQTPRTVPALGGRWPSRPGRVDVRHLHLRALHRVRGQPCRAPEPLRRPGS